MNTKLLFTFVFCISVAEWTAGVAAESKTHKSVGSQNSRVLRGGRTGIAPTPTPISGCTYAQDATNYNAAATVDSGTCSFVNHLNSLSGVVIP